MNKKHKNQAARSHNNPFESLGNLMQGAGDSFINDLVAPSANDFFEQMLGIETPKAEKHAGEMHAGEEVKLGEHKAESGEIAQEYVQEMIHPERAGSSENQEIQVRIEQILVEIKRLTESSKELELEFKDVATEAPMAEVGKYHENFLEWVLATIKTARMRIEESAGWLSAMHSKKDRKYWSMFKKHGTTFGLSNERVVATQTG